MLSRYPASRAQSQRSPQHIARAAHSSMKRKRRDSNQLDTITPRARRALDCELSPHKRARCVVPFGARREDQHEHHTGIHLIAFRTIDQARARTSGQTSTVFNTRPSST